MDTVDLGTFGCRRGDQYRLEIQGELDADANLVNLASYGTTWTAQLRPSAGSATVVDFTVDVSNIAGAVDSGADAAQLVLSLTGAQTAEMAVRQWVFDVQVTGGTLTPFTPYSGTLSIAADVTRDA